MSDLSSASNLPFLEMLERRVSYLDAVFVPLKLLRAKTLRPSSFSVISLFYIWNISTWDTGDWGRRHLTS